MLNKKENFKAVLQYNEQPVFFFRYDAQNTEENTVVCNETTFCLDNVSYENMVSTLISVKYSLDAQMALLYNYQADSVAYGEEMQNYQTWRNYCKKSAKEYFNIN